MTRSQINGISLVYEVTGSGEVPLVLVHGSWSSHYTWDGIVPLLADRFRVVTYDRRGHSQSERPAGQESICEDVEDLAGLIVYLDLAPTWVVGNSQGGLIALRLAGQRPELLRGVIAHEPPALDLVKDDPDAAQVLAEIEQWQEVVLQRIATGDHAGGAELFMEMVVGPGSWAHLPKSYQESLAYNAPTFLDEKQDPLISDFDPAWVQSFLGPVLLTTGSTSDPLYQAIFARLSGLLPGADMRVLPAAGHVPQRSQPERYAQMLQRYIEQDGQ